MTMTRFENLPLYLRSGLWLRAILVLLAIPATVCSALIWDKRPEQHSNSAVRIAGVRLQLSKRKDQMLSLNKPAVAVPYHSFILLSYLSMARNSSTVVRMHAGIIVVADVFLLAIQMYGFAALLIAMTFYYGAGGENTVGEARESKRISLLPPFYGQAEAGFLIASPILWYDSAHDRLQLGKVSDLNLPRTTEIVAVIFICVTSHRTQRAERKNQLRRYTEGSAPLAGENARTGRGN
jgi:hypothetical protein